MSWHVLAMHMTTLSALSESRNHILLNHHNMHDPSSTHQLNGNLPGGVETITDTPLGGSTFYPVPQSDV